MSKGHELPPALAGGHALDDRLALAPSFKRPTSVEICISGSAKAESITTRHLQLKLEAIHKANLFGRTGPVFPNVNVRCNISLLLVRSLYAGT